GQNNLLNAIYSRDDAEVTFTNVTYWGANGISNTGSSAIKPSRSDKEAGQNIIVEIYDSNDKLVENVTLVTDNNGQITYDLIKLNGKYKYIAYHSEDCYYTYAKYNDTFTLGDFNSLQKYINEASENSILTLYSNYTFIPVSDDNLIAGIVINKQLTINGNGFTIDAKGKSRIFKVTAGSINIINVTLKNGKADEGGAIYFENAISNSNINATYISNTANTNGGANFFNKDVLNSNITGTYISNTATMYGGANFFNKDVLNSNITGTYISNTATNGDGGANFFYISVSDSNITGTYISNTAKMYGGANYLLNSVSNSNIAGTYINNTASDSIIYFSNRSNEGLDAEITNAIFLNNKCEYEVHARTSGVVVKDSWFGNNASNYMNKPNNYNVQMGSWLFLNGANNQNYIKFFLRGYDGTKTSEYDNSLLPEINLTITTTDGIVDKSVVGLDETVKFSPAECGIKRVTAQIEDVVQTIEFSMGDFDILRGVINNANSSVINLTRNYTYNQWDTMTGGVLIDKGVVINGNGFTIDAKGKSRIFKVITGSINITNVTLKNGKADEGGAIYFENAISNSNINATYTNNTARNGGANYFGGPVLNSTIAGTYNSNNAKYGGANYFYNKVSDSNITGTYNHNNTATNGGANYFNNKVSNSTIVGTYNHNNATNNGGANYFYNSVSGSTIAGTYNHNTATNNGGANYFNYIVSGSTIAGTYNHNTATNNGGANYFSNIVSGSTIAGTYNHNNATNNGGANCFISVSNSNITGTYTNNAAINGGANYFYSDVSNLNITGTYTNTASSAIIHFQNNRDVDAKITNAIFLNNKCEYEIYAQSSGVAVKDSWFGNNASNYINKPSTLNVRMHSWLFLNATADYTSLLISDSSNIIFKLYSTDGTNISDFDNSRLPVVNLTLTATNGDVEKTTTLNNIVKYIATEHGKGSVTAKIENALHTIYFDNLLRNVDLSVSAKNITYHENEILTLTYNNTATGKVVITLKSNNYNKIIETYINQTITISDLPAGEYDVTIEYLGDNVFSNATSYANFTVEKRTTEVIPDKESIELFVDDKSKITYTLKPDYAVRNISFSSNDSNIASVDPVSGNIQAKAEGSANITISFPGSENYTASNATVTVNVKRIPTEITVDSVSLDLFVDDETVVVANLTPPEAGNVTFTSSNKNIVTVDNQGNVIAEGKGQVIITVSFAGDNKYAAAENKTIKVTVKKVNAPMNVGADDITEGENATVSVTLPGDATGNVTTKVNGKAYSSPVENGKGVITIPDLEYGNYTLPVTYSGDDKYNPLTKNVNLTVKEDEIIVSAHDLTKYYSGPEPFTVNVAYANGSAIAGKEVKITVNGVTYRKTTDENGTVSLNINLNAGTYDVAVEVDNITADYMVTVLSTINASDIESKTLNFVFTATFIDGEGNYLADGTNVSFNIKGVIYDSQVTGDKGSASIHLTLDRGRYIITSYNPVSDEYASNSIAVDLKDV
ncbi:Ig-like domain repeat protein, partial [uncultured Methanobrevibacter sp.]|uniref:beta strand repeat-containing protein n=1 Tax=uncultured Methanobrevibacter sp. TaxID=253161 RepID=UPI0025FE82C0